MGYQSTMLSKRLAAIAFFVFLPCIGMEAPAGANLKFERQWSVGAQPTSLDLDAAGRTYVATTGEQIIAFDAKGDETDRWGSNGNGNGQFLDIGGIAVDRNDGLLYATDFNLDRVQKFRLNGDFIQPFGTGGSAVGQLNRPQGIAASADGTVYVAEEDNHRVQHFGDTGFSLRAWGSFGYEEATQFDAPRAIAVGPNGHVFVGDSVGFIREFDADGDFVRRFGGQDPTPVDGLDNGRFGSENGAYAVAVDSFGLVYAVDYDYDRIQVFSRSGNFLAKIGTTGSGASRFNQPVDVAIGRSNRLYVADQGNGRVQVFSTTGLRPNNNFSFSRKAVNRKKGFTVLSVRVPGTGRVQLLGSARNRPATVRSRARSTVRLKVVVKGRTLRQLRQRKRLAVPVRVRFTPNGGLPRTKATRVTLALR
jgi:DNA-binding beta-propeller fold protein YncE